jgi:cyclopropane-fatty-acyl-phospholipid synthase
MKKSPARQTVQEILAESDVEIDGSQPWDLRVHHPDFYQRVLAGGSLALGESYMDGWWDCPALDQFFDRILAARLEKKIRTSPAMRRAVLKAKITNLQRGSKAYIIGKRHYDIGNRLFRMMLDKRMNYSCAYWQPAATLDDAQEAKLELICRKLGLEPGMQVLDIGCGWGGFAKYAAETFGVGVMGLTVSRQQVEFASDYCQGFDVRIELKDYRQAQGQFDRIVSIGMFEHVGLKNYATFMRVAHRCLRPDGLFLLHTIGGNASTHAVDPWFNKYIFPNSMLPSAKQITTAAEGRFVLEDWHSLGPHYDRTLMAWHDNFTRNWDTIKDDYDQRFYRMWTYYLLVSAGAFRCRSNQLWQIVFSKNGLKGGHYDRWQGLI